MLTLSPVLVFSADTEDVVVPLLSAEALLLGIICHAREFCPKPLNQLALQTHAWTIFTP